MGFTPEKCKDAVSCLTHLYKLKQKDILGRTRKEYIVYVRHLLIYFFRKELKGGVVEIGHCMGLDHTTITHATNQFSDRLETNCIVPVCLKTIYDYTTTDYSNTRKIILQAL